MHYLGRHPILDRKQALFGYEFFVQRDKAESAPDDAVLDSASVLVSLFSGLGAEQVLADKQGFVQLAPELLEEETLSLFPRDRLVLQIKAGDQADAALVDHCNGLRARGYRLALDNFTPNPVSLALLPLMAFIKIDAQQANAERMQAYSKALRQFPAKLIATRVDSPATAQSCRELGLDYFQGFYFARPGLLEDRSPDSSKLTIIQILNQLMGQAEIDALEESISRDAALSFRLLRYINSAGHGQTHEISSIRRALVALGRQQLYRWLTLILFAGTSDAPPSALVATAAARGRLAELLGQQAGNGQLNQRDSLDQLFIVGMFSLMEPLLNTPLSRILQELHLPEAIVAALTLHQGPYGPVLSLVEAVEAGDTNAMRALGAQLNLTGDVISKTYLEAMAWAATL
ncbi:MAG: EAL and HDOD domain-containing protein [Pseudomonadota bacterium]